MVNFHGSYQITSGHAVHTVTARVHNVGDKLCRNNLSYIKDLTPEMGRSFGSATTSGSDGPRTPERARRRTRAQGTFVASNNGIDVSIEEEPNRRLAL